MELHLSDNKLAVSSRACFGKYHRALRTCLLFKSHKYVLVAAVAQSLRWLTTLFSHAPSQALPAELGALPRLRILRCRRNKLSALPASLGGAGALLELHAGFNAITALPEGLGALRSLAVLEVRNNLLAVSVWGLHSCPRWSQHASTVSCTLLHSALLALGVGGRRLCALLTHAVTRLLICSQEFPVALCGLPLTLLDLTANRWGLGPPSACF